MLYTVSYCRVRYKWRVRKWIKESKEKKRMCLYIFHFSPCCVESFLIVLWDKSISQKNIAIFLRDCRAHNQHTIPLSHKHSTRRANRTNECFIHIHTQKLSTDRKISFNIHINYVTKWVWKCLWCIKLSDTSSVCVLVYRTDKIDWIYICRIKSSKLEPHKTKQLFHNVYLSSN